MTSEAGTYFDGLLIHLRLSEVVALHWICRGPKTRVLKTSRGFRVDEDASLQQAMAPLVRPL
jgi:hypothetical protein